MTIDDDARPGSTRDDDGIIRRLFEEAPALICILRGPQHVYELVNPAYQRLFGERRLLGRPIREALPELDSHFIELLDHAYRTGDPHTGNEVPVALDYSGSGALEERFFNFIYQPLHTTNETIDGVSVFGFDVTDQVRARRRFDDELRTSHERVRRSEEMFRLLVESVKDYAIFMLDREGRVVSWNAGAERIKGYEASEVLGRHFSIFYPEEDARRGDPMRELESAREQGSVHVEGWRVRKNGTVFWADIVVTAVFDASGELRGYAKVTRDITERKEAEETQRALFEQRAARLKAEDANRAKDEFIALVSHELRTPLTSILGWARMLRMGRLDHDTTMEALDALERSAQAQVHLVEDLLDTARITSGKLRLETRALDLKPIVESAIADITPAAEAKRITITADVRCGCSMLGDPTRLQQVIWNLLSNAIKFTPEGGSVFVQLREVDSQAHVEIRDNGRGIERELLPRIFTRFEQGDPAAKDRVGGLGLGLALSRHLVEQHGGTIRAESGGRDQGATFTIRFPLIPGLSESFVDRDSGRVTDLPRLDGVHVLIVEDEVDNREMLRTIAEHCGAEVRTTATAQDALEAIAQSRPDVLVADIALPDYDGCWLLEQATLKIGAKIPALALTVFGSRLLEQKVVEAGFDVYRQKPIEPSDFAHSIARLVRRSSVTNESS